MAKQQKKIQFGDVDLTKPHFCISWKNNLISDDYKVIMVLSVAETVDEMRLCLLEHDISFEDAINSILYQVNYYLYELKNYDPILYLIYHSKQSMANIYSNVMFSYIENIDKNCMLYYIIAKSKIICIYNNRCVSKILSMYMDRAANDLFKRKINEEDNSVYNNDFIEFYNIICNYLPKADEFELKQKFSFIEFSKWIKKLTAFQFSNIINYLNKIRIIKIKDNIRFVNLHYRITKEFNSIKSI